MVIHEHGQLDVAIEQTIYSRLIETINIKSIERPLTLWDEERHPIVSPYDIWYRSYETEKGYTVPLSSLFKTWTRDV